MMFNVYALNASGISASLWHVVVRDCEATDEMCLVPARECLQYALAVVQLGLYCDVHSRLAQPKWGELAAVSDMIACITVMYIISISSETQELINS